MPLYDVSVYRTIQEVRDEFVAISIEAGSKEEAEAAAMKTVEALDMDIDWEVFDVFQEDLGDMWVESMARTDA